MNRNQRVLARMIAIHALGLARRRAQISPHEQLMAAVEEALVDARQRRDDLVAQGMAGSRRYLELNEKIARWESARRNNR